MQMFRAAMLLALPLAGTLALPVQAGDSEWSTLKGQVIYAGTAKPNQKADLLMNKDEKACLKNGPIIKEDLVVNKKNNGLQWVVVWLAKEDDGKADHRAELPIHPSL